MIYCYTVSDFTAYLRKKEALLKESGCDFLVPGEEELLATYLMTVEAGHRHDFPEFERGAYVVLKEGSWTAFKESPLYRARAEANELSHLWDDLIEYQASHLIHGSAQGVMDGGPAAAPENSEHLLRIMASEDRLTRRALGSTLAYGRTISSDRGRWLRTIASPDNKRLYCFLFLPHFSSEQSYEEYVRYRQYLLHLHCEGALLRFPKARQIIGIAPAPYASAFVSVDFMLLQARDEVGITEEDRQDLEEALRAEGIWNPAAVRLGWFKDVVYRPRPASALDRVRRTTAALWRAGARVWERIWAP